jgi:hypothetical protein
MLALRFTTAWSILVFLLGAQKEGRVRTCHNRNLQYR